MCECDSTIRDLRQSLDRAYNKITEQQLEIDTKDKQLLDIRGVLRVLSFSMSMNSKARSLDEARWQDVSRHLAKKLALRMAQPAALTEHLVYQIIAEALDATETVDPNTNQVP